MRAIKNKMDLIYLLTIALVSFSFSVIIGFQFINAEPISIWKKLKEVKIGNIESHHNFKQVNTGEIHFINGFPYETDINLYLSGVSSFYQRNINNISTSAYWNNPIHNVNSKLIVTKKSEIELITDELNGLPIISIIAQADDFFSYENGIYVQGKDGDFLSSKLFYPFPWHRPANYYKKIDDKRKIHFSYYDEKGNAKYNSFAFAEINGKATRCFPQKSLRLTASKELGNKKFNFDFFGDDNSYQSLVLRNGGNDNSKSLFRDMLMQSLVKDCGVITSGFIPCEVYLNGEYWGIHFIQNRIDENFISEKYKVKEKEITLVETWNLDKGSELEFNKLLKFVKSKKMDLNSASEVIDIDNLVSFLAAEMYFANTDWPENNLKMYKITDSKNETKWKFVLCDLDYGFGYTGPDAINMDMFDFLLKKNDLFSKMFQQLMKDDSFKHKLKGELIKMYTNNSSYFINPKIKNLYNQLEGSIENHTARWGKPSTVKDWEDEVAVLYDFAKNRGGVIWQQINKYL